jgi:hypothetical protein
MSMPNRIGVVIAQLLLEARKKPKIRIESTNKSSSKTDFDYGFAVRFKQIHSAP